MYAMCIFGRGIEKVKTSKGYEWRPTRFIEKLSEKGWHTGYRIEGLDPDDEVSVIAGANANVLASVQLYKRLREKGCPPKLIIFAAGHPQYLAVDDPSEGVILRSKFARMTKVPENEMKIQEKNKNTRDDLMESLKATKENGLNHLIIITVSVHIERIKELLNLVVKEYPKLNDIKVRFRASEKLLLSRYHSVPAYEKMLEQLTKSAAYQRTFKKEQKGVEALREGTYDFASQGCKSIFNEQTVLHLNQIEAVAHKIT